MPLRGMGSRDLDSGGSAALHTRLLTSCRFAAPAVLVSATRQEFLSVSPRRSPRLPFRARSGNVERLKLSCSTFFVVVLVGKVFVRKVFHQLVIV